MKARGHVLVHGLDRHGADGFVANGLEQAVRIRSVGQETPPRRMPGPTVSSTPPRHWGDSRFVAGLFPKRTAQRSGSSYIAATASATVCLVPSLIELQLDVLLARDAHGRLATTRDPTSRHAPRAFLGRSRDDNVWAVRRDVDKATIDALDHLCSSEPRLTAPRAELGPACRERVLELLAPVENGYRGPAYVLPDRLPDRDCAREVAQHRRPRPASRRSSPFGGENWHLT